MSQGASLIDSNGVIVVNKGKVLDTRPGQQIRFPVEAKGRFEPVSKEGWLSQNTIVSNPTPSIDNTGMESAIHKHWLEQIVWSELFTFPPIETSEQILSLVTLSA